MDSDLEILIAAGVDPAIAIAAVERDAPRESDAKPKTKARGAWLVGLLLGMAAALAVSFLIGR